MKNILNALRKNSDNLVLFVVFFFCMCLVALGFLCLLNDNSTPAEKAGIIAMSCVYIIIPVVVLVSSWEK